MQKSPRRSGEKNPPVREEPASHLASRRCPRRPAKCQISGRSPYPLHANGGKYAKKINNSAFESQHKDLETIRQKAVQAHMSQSDYVISCCLGKKIIILDGLKGSPAAAKSHRQQPQPADCAGEHGESPVRQSGFCRARVRKNQYRSAGNAGRGAVKSQSSIS